MIKKHQIEDVMWFSFENNIAFTLEELLIGLEKEDRDRCLVYLN